MNVLLRLTVAFESQLLNCSEREDAESSTIFSPVGEGHLGTTTTSRKNSYL